jgi:hypothetical protein
MRCLYVLCACGFVKPHTVRPCHTADRNTAGRAIPPRSSGNTGCQNTNVPVSGIPPVAQHRRFSQAAQGGGISMPCCTRVPHLSCNAVSTPPSTVTAKSGRSQRVLKRLPFFPHTNNMSHNDTKEILKRRSCWYHTSMIQCTHVRWAVTHWKRRCTPMVVEYTYTHTSKYIYIEAPRARCSD